MNAAIHGWMIGYELVYGSINLFRDVDSFNMVECEFEWRIGMQ
jgi:hypothetical protein